jgi:hypothetical protein
MDYPWEKEVPNQNWGQKVKEHYPFYPKFNREHLPSWVVHMYDTMSLGGKHNTPKPGNHISTLMISAYDL